MESIDTLVVGAGVIGLACADALARAGRDVVIIDADSQYGSGVSSRNSEVVHSGIYYPPGSAKARLCVHGRRQLYDFCAEHGVPHRRCGKLIVAAHEGQIPDLEKLLAHGQANDVEALRLIDRAEAQRRRCTRRGQGGRELCRRREPVGRKLRERGHHRRLDMRRHGAALRDDRPRLLGEHARDDRLRAGPRERRLAGEHLVGHRA